ncbi:MAG: ester cyclase [Anaerolineae bacterium]|nr:ester cyclase [Anaerolineae bacterium]
MANEENKTTVHAFWQAITANDEDALREVLAPDLVAYNQVGSAPQSREEHIQGILQWSQSFSANRFEIEEQICEGSTVVTRGVMRAVHSEDSFQGVPPSGIELAVPGITIERIADGRIAERHVCSDRLGLLQSLGILPAPQAGGESASGRDRAKIPVGAETDDRKSLEQMEDTVMNGEEQKAIARRYFHACQGNDQSTLKAVLSAELVAHHPGLAAPLNRDALLHMIDSFSEAFSAQEYTIEEQVAEGDTVASRVTWRATHSGPFQDVPATGRQIAVGGIAISRIQNGQIVERWLTMDQMGMLKQLGLVP